MRPTTSRRLALATATALGLGTVTLAAAPAHAADWTTVVSIHKARSQVCKESVRGGVRVRLRLDNRNSAHGHEAGMSRNGGTSVTVRAAAGEVSGVKSLVFQRGDELVVGLGEFTGEGLGGDQDLARIGAC